MRRAASISLLAITIGAAAPQNDIATGARIVAHGTSSGALPCMACHGADLQGNRAIGAPALAGLPVDVTLASLEAIASGRIGRNYVMKNNARAMTPAERRAVAAYLASLKPGG